MKWGFFRENISRKLRSKIQFSTRGLDIVVCHHHMAHVVGTEWIGNLQEPRKHLSKHRIHVTFKSHRYVLSKAYSLTDFAINRKYA